MKNLKNDISTGTWKRIYLWHGDELYLKKASENEMRSKIIPPGAELMNVDVFEGKAMSVDAFIDAAETLPFMCDYRLIFLRETGLFTSGRRNDSEKMEKYISGLPETTIVVCVESEIDKRGKLYKAVGKIGRTVEFTTPAEKELAAWSVGRLKKGGKTISPSAVSLLIRMVSADMSMLEMEINKLIDYTGSNASAIVTEDDVRLICTQSLEAKVFDLMAAIGNKKMEAALAMYNNLMFMRESPLGILSLIARQFKMMLQCTDLQKKGYSQSDIEPALGLRSYAVSEYLRQGKNFSARTMYNAFQECLATDISIKTGRMNDRTAVEILIVKYCGVT